MKLEYLFEMNLIYDPGVDYPGTFALVLPYGSNEGSGYGGGMGTISGKINGKVQWVNHPHFRSDGWNLPDAKGVIITEDRAMIMFSAKGLARLNKEEGLGKIIFTATLEAQAQQYQWVNTTIFVAEAIYHLQTASIHAKFFSCASDFEFSPN